MLEEAPVVKAQIVPLSGRAHGNALCTLLGFCRLVIGLLVTAPGWACGAAEVRGEQALEVLLSRTNLLPRVFVQEQQIRI